MKALTIRQPWAWAIARGHKTIENRTWTTTYRGPIAIHAAKRWDPDRDYIIREMAPHVHPVNRALAEAIDEDKPYSDTGRIVAVVDLVGVCTASLTWKPCDCGPWAIGGHAHWRLANWRPFAGPEISGRLGLWEWEDHHDG